MQHQAKKKSMCEEWCAPFYFEQIEMHKLNVTRIFQETKGDMHT